MKSKFNIPLQDGTRCDIEVGLEDYKAAARLGLTLSEFLNRKFTDADTTKANVLEHCMASAGLFLRKDRYGMSPPTIADVFEGNLEIAAGLTRGTGEGNNTVTGRLLFPEIIMQMIAHELESNHDDFLGGYNRMIAQTQSIAGPKFEQPIINASAPEGVRAQPISQLATPPTLVSITLSEVTRRIPTKSIGLEFSDEALRATTLDLVSIILNAQSRQERIVMVEDQLAGMINGDVDAGESAIAAFTANSLDSTLAAGAISHKAWIKFLRLNYRKLSINHCIMDIDTALKLENRSGKPTNQNDDPNSPRIDTLFSVDNLGTSPPAVLLVDPAVVGADTIIGLDSRWAIRRVINVEASYQAIEQFVLRRATAMRFDFGEMAHKLYVDAWQKMTLT